MGSLAQRRILLALGGGIAAYKSAELCRLLRKAGAEVRVVMTPAAAEFITPLTLQALSGHPVRTTLLDPAAEAGMGHIELARWAELIVIAPATADLIARLAAGLGNDLLTTVSLASEAPTLLAPAMNQAMWRDRRTQDNVSRLSQLGMRFVGPASGEQACGDEGPGRMTEPEEIFAAVSAHFTTATRLQGRHVVITAGPTREAIDPVRYISNHSSGKMGYALAEAARDAGARVTLISGPVALPTPAGVERIDCTSAGEMLEAALATLDRCDIFIAAAAVADYRVAKVAGQKIKKSAEQLSLALVRNPDVLATVAAQPKRPFCVGFAAETEQVVAHAREKLQRKQLNLVVANDVSVAGLGFNSDDNAVILIDENHERAIGPMNKRALAQELVAAIADAYEKQRQ